MAETVDTYIYPNVLTTSQTAQLIKLSSTLSFEHSKVYNPAESANHVRLETRQSKTAYLSLDESPDLRKMIHALLLSLSCTGLSSVSLARRHVTFIRYDEGDFFSWHNDYTRHSSMSRTFEGHLLVCLQAPTEGGELIIDDGRGQTTSYTYKPCEAILFDKSMRHQALPVVKGCKLIISIDVEAVRRSTIGMSPEICKAQQQGRDVLIRDIDIIDVLANSKDICKLPIFLVIKNGKKIVAYDSTGFIGGSKAHANEAKRYSNGGIVDCRNVMDMLGGSYMFDEYVGWPLNLAPFAPFSNCLTRETFSKIMTLPVIGADRVLTAMQEPEWCNEEYDSGYSVSFDTYVYVPFSML